MVYTTVYFVYSQQLVHRTHHVFSLLSHTADLMSLLPRQVRKSVLPCHDHDLLLLPLVLTLLDLRLLPLPIVVILLLHLCQEEADHLQIVSASSSLLCSPIMLSCVSTEDLENRFRFSDSLPTPERWTHGPKIYPSKSRDAGTSQ